MTEMGICINMLQCKQKDPLTPKDSPIDTSILLKAKNTDDEKT